jgi:hypothetical protein
MIKCNQNQAKKLHFLRQKKSSKGTLRTREEEEIITWTELTRNKQPILLLLLLQGITSRPRNINSAT